MLERLRRLGVQIVIAANQTELTTRRQLGDIVDLVDELICHEHVGTNKGSGAWLTTIRNRTGFEPNQLFLCREHEV
jgi:hypothetical protein